MGRPKGSKNGESAHDRFWRKVNVLGDHWLWTGAIAGKTGRGSFWIDSTHWVAAHRFAYLDQIGPITEGLEVLHSCDIPLCMRGAHLFLGTQLANLADMVTKHRSHRGFKLSDADVRLIKDSTTLGISQTTLAESFGISKSAISLIVNGKRWTRI